MVESSNIKIAVAAHKPYWMPSDSMYVPLQAGALGNDSLPGFRRDDEGDTISEKNPRYCELTVLYWAWKNLDADYIGLAHYRRHFAGSGERGVATAVDIAKDLETAPILLPTKRRYFIETVESHYGHTFDSAHIDALKAVLADGPAAYLDEFNRRMAMRSSHIYNMMVMRKDILDEWMNWLMPVLYRTEELINFEGMTPFQARCMGRLSERLLDTWLSVAELPVVERRVCAMEPTDWGAKIRGFLGAKFFGRKYEKSF